VSLIDRWLASSTLYRAGEAEVRERDGVRTLHLATSTVQSAMRLARPDDLELSYTRAMMACLLFVERPRAWLLVGLGAGSIAKYVHLRLPRASIRAVEIAPEVVSIARSHFGLPDDERLAVEVGDGATYVERHASSADALLIDAYDGRSQAPALGTAGFYRACRAALRPGGVAAINLWSSVPEFDATLRHIENAFDGRCLCLPAERPGNVIAFGLDAVPRDLSWTGLAALAGALEASHPLEFRRFVAGLKTMNRHDREGISL